MKIIILLTCLFLLIGIGQAQVTMSGKGTGNTITITNDEATINSLISDSISTVVPIMIGDSIAFPVDTTALKLLNMAEGRVAYVRSGTGKGWWTVVDSSESESYCIVAAPHPTAAKQWQRDIFRIRGVVYAQWALDGDFAIADTIGGISRDDATLLNIAIGLGTKFYFEPGGTYYTSETIVVTNKILVGNRAAIYSVCSGTSGNPKDIMHALGTITTDTTSLTVDAGLHSDSTYVYSIHHLNKLVVANPDSFSRGDIVLVNSDSIMFGSTPVGELGEVRFVEADTLWLQKPLHSVYTTANNGLVWRINAATFHLEGGLTLESIGQVNQDRESETAYTIGITLRYVRDAFITGLIVRNVDVVSIKVSNCYVPNIDAHTINSRRKGNGYGIMVADATMDAQLNLVVDGARHCFTSGASTATGVSWGTRLSGSFYPSPDTLGTIIAIDCHSETGSAFFSNCTIYLRGSVNNDGYSVEPIAFNLAGNQIIIKDCIIYGPRYVIKARGDINELFVDGVDVVDGSGGIYAGFFLIDKDIAYTDVRFSNIRCPGMQFMRLESESLTGYQISNISLDNIRAGLGFRLSLPFTTLPTSFVAKNLHFEITKDHSNSTAQQIGAGDYAITIYQQGGGQNALRSVIFENIYVKGFEHGIVFSGDTLDFVSIKNFTAVDTHLPIAVTNSQINRFVVSDVTIDSMSTHSSAALLYNRHSKPGDIDTLTIRDVEMNTGYYLYTAREDTGATVLRAIDISGGPNYAGVLENADDVTSLVMSAELSPWTRGTAAFTTTDVIDTVAISGATATDFYILTPTGGAVDTLDVLMSNPGTDTLFVRRPAGGTSSLSYDWFRFK